MNTFEQELYENAERNGLIHTVKSFGTNIKVSVPLSKALCDANINELELSVRAQNGLMRAGTDTIRKLSDIIMSEKGLAQIRNLGSKSISEIKTAVFARAYESLDKEEKLAFWHTFLEENPSFRQDGQASEDKSLTKTDMNKLLDYLSYYYYDFEDESIHIRDGKDSILAENAYQKVLDSYQLIGKSNSKWCFDIALAAVSELNQEDIEYIVENRKIEFYHFGLGMYIRNQYIYCSKLHYYFMADMVSGNVEPYIYAIILPDYEFGSSTETE